MSTDNGKLPVAELEERVYAAVAGRPGKLISELAKEWGVPKNDIILVADASERLDRINEFVIQKVNDKSPPKKASEPPPVKRAPLPNSETQEPVPEAKKEEPAKRLGRVMICDAELVKDKTVFDLLGTDEIGFYDPYENYHDYVLRKNGDLCVVWDTVVVHFENLKSSAECKYEQDVAQAKKKRDWIIKEVDEVLADLKRDKARLTEFIDKTCK